MIVNNYPPKVGGVEFHVENLARELAQLGHKVWVLDISATPGTRHEQNVTVITRKAHLPIADVITIPALGTTRKIAKFLTEQQIDVVSTHTRFFPMSFVGLRAAKLANIPILHTEHGSGFVATKNPIIWTGSRFVDITVGKYVLKKATKVLGVSEAVTQFVKRLANVDATVFYNAITPPQLNIKSDDRLNHLVFVGRIVPGKGWDVFINAVAQLRKEGFEVDGELLGDGADLATARSLIQKHGLEKDLQAPGRVSQQEVRQRIAGATLVNPTVLSEGFQTTLVEAIAERGRVVTFPVPGAQMLVTKKAPVLISKERTTDSLVASLRSMLLHPLPQAQLEIYQDLTWPAQARKYASICGALIQRQSQ